MTARLKEKYTKEIAAALQKDFNIENVMQIPKLEKISINMGLGTDGVADAKSVNKAAEELALIAGQRPVITRAKKSIAGFKLREGVPVGCKVTLRGEMMYEFLDRFVHIALPRVRDFRGLSGKSFNDGNYSVGLKEQIVFPEVEYDKVDKVRGMDITFVTSTKDDEQAKKLLAYFNMPFMN